MTSHDKGDFIHLAESPWGKAPKRPRSGGGGHNGSGNGGGHGNDDMPPELEALIRGAQKKFKGFGGGDGTSKGSVGFLFLMLFVIWCATGLYRIQPSEHGVLLTFGKWTDTKTNAGLGYHMPWPIQHVRKVDVALDRRVVVGFRDSAAARSRFKGATTGDVPFESLMVTGDENIINIHFVVLWHINDAGKYLFQIRNPETTIKKVAESAMREIIGRTKIQQALTEARGEVEINTRTLMQGILDEYSSGISVSNVQLQKVDPPEQVVDAFDDVQRARADKERLKNEAETYMNDVVPRARGEAQKLLQGAEGYKAATINKAEGESQRFLSVYKAYKQAKNITKKRIYIETMQEILQNSKKIIVSENGGTPILPYLPLDQLKPGTRTGSR